MRRIGVCLLLLGTFVPLGGCVYHFPSAEPAAREGFERVHILESVGYAVASSLLTIGVHELGHAAMGGILGGEDIEIAFFDEGHLGVTRMRGNFSDDNLLLLDVAGLIATYGLGEALELLVLEETIPERAQPFFATWSLVLKGDLYLQAGQSPFVDSSDLAKFSDRSGFPKWGYLGLIGTDLLFHHTTYLEMIEESRSFKPEKE